MRKRPFMFTMCDNPELAAKLKTMQCEHRVGDKINKYNMTVQPIVALPHRIRPTRLASQIQVF
jgi:hypothetical protein